jgi:hypothetical protein
MQHQCYFGWLIDWLIDLSRPQGLYMYSLLCVRACTNLRCITLILILILILIQVISSYKPPSSYKPSFSYKPSYRGWDSRSRYICNTQTKPRPSVHSPVQYISLTRLLGQIQSPGPAQPGPLTSLPVGTTGRQSVAILTDTQGARRAGSKPVRDA